MDSLFSLDSALMRWMARATDLLILNLLFVLSCIPIITIGTAITSMYEVTLKMVKDEESYVFRTYLKGLKRNFKKSTIAWMIYLAFFVILYVDLVVAVNMGGMIWVVLYFVFLGVGILMWILMGYIFPLQAQFDNSIKNTFTSGLVMILKHFMTSMVMLITNSIFLFCLLYNGYTFIYGILVYLFIGFSTVAYINSKFLSKVFKVYINQIEEKNNKNEQDIIEG